MGGVHLACIALPPGQPSDTPEALEDWLSRSGVGGQEIPVMEF